MLLNSWSLVLLVTSAAALFLAGGSSRTAIRILRHWDGEADTAEQIELENETWLSALLMKYGMMLQLVTLVLLVMAADNYSGALVGAMCATGAFLANPFGIPLLLVKIIGVFIYGFWLVLHRLDLASERMVLTRTKALYQLLLVPLLFVDLALLVAYLIGLEPDIVTSCCGVVFSSIEGDGKNLLGPLPVVLVMSCFYGLAVLLFILSLFSKQKIDQRVASGDRIIGFLLTSLWLLFFSLALVVITAVISSYIYRMPFHRCPFDILKKEYFSIGYLIYFTLFTATFFGMSGGLTSFLARIDGLQLQVVAFRKTAFRICLVLLPFFIAVISWFPAVYLLAGGDR